MSITKTASARARPGSSSRATRRPGRKPNAVPGRRSGVLARISTDGKCFGSGEYEVGGQRHTGDYFAYVDVFDAKGKPVDHGEAIFFGTGPLWVSHEDDWEECRPAGVARLKGAFYPHATWRGGDHQSGQVTVGSTLARIAESPLLSVSAVPGRPDEADLLDGLSIAERPSGYTAVGAAELCAEEGFSLDVTLRGFPGRRFRIGPDWTAHELVRPRRKPKAAAAARRPRGGGARRR